MKFLNKVKLRLSLLSYFFFRQMGKAVCTSSTSHHKQASVKAKSRLLSQICFNVKVVCLYGRRKTYAQYQFRLSFLPHQFALNCCYPNMASLASPQSPTIIQVDSYLPPVPLSCSSLAPVSRSSGQTSAKLSTRLLFSTKL